MLTSKDFVAVLVALVTLIVMIAVQRHGGKSSRPATTPLPAKSGTGSDVESDVNKDRHPGGE
jgi:hypothetical protein